LRSDGHQEPEIRHWEYVIKILLFVGERIFESFDHYYLVLVQFAPEEYEFSFQRTQVHLALCLESFVSRSEARRIHTGLNKFRDIVLDFKNIKKIGQGCTDEIFRVFHKRYPDIVIKTENVLPNVRQMIKNVVGTNFNF